MRGPFWSSDLGKLSLIGGGLGLGFGLILGVWLEFRPAAPLSPGNAVPTQFHQPTGVLSAENPEPDAGKAAAQTHPSESDHAQAVRHRWHAKVISKDYEGAVFIIQQSRLTPVDKTNQLTNLIDALFPDQWINTHLDDFPECPEIDSLYQEPGGPARLKQRWTVARSIVMQMAPSLDKSQRLSRLELYAQILDAVPRVHQKPKATDQALVETDENGTLLPSKSTAEVSSTPIIDFDHERQALDTESDATMATLDATPPEHKLSRVVVSGWGLARTGLLGMAGALLSATGGLLLKSYTDLLMRGLRYLPSVGLLTSNDPHALTPDSTTASESHA